MRFIKISKIVALGMVALLLGNVADTAVALGNHKQVSQAKQEAAAINASLGMYKHSQPIPTSVNLWPILSEHFRLTQYYDRPEVRHEIIRYLSNKKYLEHMLRNAVPYIYYVYQQTQARDMPAEFALLPMVESGYDPFAYSPAGATGIWQIMPGTASSLGLDINWWYDARRDTVVSTQASLNYLGSLHGTLHNWLLAAAAYDAGIGAVRAAMEENQRMRRGVYFWDLPLPHETQLYVPKLLALAAIIRYAVYYHVKLPYIPNHPHFSAVNMNSQIDLIEAGRLAGVPADVIRRLNPGMRRWATNPNGIYALLIPSDKSETFKRNLGNLAGKSHISWQYHEVRTGETLTKIAKIYHTSAGLLRLVNGLKNNHVEPEQGLLVPLYLNQTYSIPVANVKTDVSVSVLKLLKPAQKVKEDELKRLLVKIYGQNNT